MWQNIKTLLGRKVLFGMSGLEIGGVVIAAALAFYFFSPPGRVSLAEYLEQHPGAKAFTDGVISLSGTEVSCNNLPIVFDDTFPDDAGAWQRGGYVSINPKTLFTRPKVQQLFTFYHECSHMDGVDDEQEADCYSIRAGVKNGWLDAAGIETLCKFWRPLRGDNTHASGPERCANMQRCFAEASKS